MQKWLLGILAAALLVAGAMLFWQTRTASPKRALPSEVASDSPSAPRIPGNARSPAAGATKPVPNRSSEDQAMAPSPMDENPQWDPLAEETTESHLASLRLSGDVPQRIMYAAGQACYRGEPGRYERMRVKYTLRYRDGKAKILDAEFLDSKIGQPRMEQCVVETMRGLSWSDPKAPDVEVEQIDSLSVLDLQKRAPLEFQPKRIEEPDE